MKEATQSTVKVIFEDGDYFVTRINLNKEEAVEHYLNKSFNVGNGIYDLYKKCIKVEIL